jgi:broad specificity phosphatase PhoE
VKPPALVYLARHGQTESNAARRYAGYSQEPLTDVGRSQMSGLGARLALAGIGEIWTSEVARARESAELLGGILAAPVVAEARLNEIRMGPWEGMGEREVAQQYPNEYALWCSLPDRLVLEGRETLDALATRVMSVVGDAARRSNPVLLMTHVAPIRVAVLRALGLPLSAYKRVTIGNGDTVVVDGGRAQAQRLGEHRSLRHELRAGKESSLA